MTISTRIRGELFAVNDPQNAETVETVASPQLIRLPLTRPPNGLSKRSKKKKPKKVSPVKVEAAVADQLASHRHGLPWTIEEHDRFLQGLEQYPCGPWKAVAAFVGTRTPRQTMTHAQKYRQKIQRRRRGLMTSSRQPVPVSSDVYGGLVITTTQETCAPTTGVDTSKSPTAVDTVPSATGLMENHPLCPLESNWFESVAVEELDAAFRAFLEGYDPSQLSLDDQQHEFDAFKEENVISL
ncbi:hypothetical protein PHYBOEH_009621 [Phytophthora boehmeriae]|uniref:Myb-like DNA-binding protein n=1 Tax=Phytophthora boehmeriae TaxID=109152 RepID=A0A8T1X0V0_9STRA|nr:hypothetical protein PHYBOEH_009621 [Phytophthora boehmeriae]